MPKLIKFILLIFLIKTTVYAANFYELKIDFESQINGLCFKNSKFDSEHPLTSIANKYGACNGMSSITEYFYNNAIFDCSKKKENKEFYKYTINDIIEIGNNKCDKKIIIPGYCNLKEFCNDFTKYFSEKAIDLNANKTLFGVDSDINFILKTNSQNAFEINIETLYSIYNNLKENKPTRILYYKKGFGGHVVLIHGLDIFVNNNSREYLLQAWDPNFPDENSTIIMTLDSSIYFFSHSNTPQTHNQDNFCKAQEKNFK